MALRVGGEAAKAGKPVARFYGSLEIAKGAWNTWLRSADWAGLGRVILSVDHEQRTLETLAATDNRTLSFNRKEVGSDEWLAYEALIEDDPDRATRAQLDVIRLLTQPTGALIKEVSVGLILLKYHWEFAADPDLDREEDTLVCEKAAMFEMSLIPKGAMGPDGNIRVLDDGLAADGVATVTLRGGLVREYLEGAAGEIIPAGAGTPGGDRLLAEKAAAKEILESRLDAVVVSPETVHRIREEAAS